MLPVQSFLNFIAQNQLFTQNDRLLVAVSGGRDSVVLAHLLKQAGFNFGIAHCNFQLRIDEAQAEQAFTSQLADALTVPFHTISFDTQTYARQNGISTQMAARDLRYTWFEQIRNEHGYSYIAVAHHQNDSVETILLNLTRGTGIAGMHGILPQNGYLVRPLLFLNRDEIDTIVDQNGLHFMEDSSNASSKYARNKIRHQVIPPLKELNPKLEETFDRNMERFRELELLLNHQLEQLKQQMMVQVGDEIHLHISAVKSLYPQRLLLYGLLHPYGFSEPVIEDVMASLDKHAGRVFESQGFVLLLDRDKLILSKRRERPGPVLIHQNDHEVYYSQFKITLLHDDSPLIIRDNPMALSANADKLIFPLTIRSWQEGDYFCPMGMKGKKKLSDFFVNEKIPLHQKDQIPILINGNGEVIWIAGHRPDERYKVSEHTEKVIIFELYKLNL
ncbi:tRNA lysidine(34) synthetase TilS [Mucilaginibacter paludis]|uniref:tRNA(Ile)-lysidine synthase n=1 Tax=Mucilaginibacter paludis DSM 18603 TaxID=714943 RepID=H1Y4A4_9SPHI|nr:tRNA lysidine(34) synthetase TilS [Mucilaginibacter paludis]EHQ25738.1 tRNA(Ile)-lysidine synthase [Mucilaginibacter paludis DSM 18603]